MTERPKDHESPQNPLGKDVGPFHRREDAARRLGVTPEEVDRLATARELIWVDVADTEEVFFPVSQWREDGSLNTGLVAAWREWEPMEWTGALWCVTPLDELDGVTPAEWTGDPETLRILAVRYANSGLGQ